MVTGKEVHTQKIDFLRLFGKKVVSDVSRWAWHRRNRVINREKPIVLKLAQQTLKFFFGFSEKYTPIAPIPLVGQLFIERSV